MGWASARLVGEKNERQVGLNGGWQGQERKERSFHRDLHARLRGAATWSRSLFPPLSINHLSLQAHPVQDLPARVCGLEQGGGSGREGLPREEIDERSPNTLPSPSPLLALCHTVNPHPPLPYSYPTVKTSSLLDVRAFARARQNSPIRQASLPRSEHAGAPPRTSKGKVLPPTPPVIADRRPTGRCSRQ